MSNFVQNENKLLIDFNHFISWLRFFLLECRKEIGSTMQRNWRTKLAPFFHSIIKSWIARRRTFSRASRWLHVFTSSFDWFTVFSLSFVIGCNNYFGFTRHSVEKRSVTTLIWWWLHKLQDLFYHWTTIGDILLSVAKMTREKINFWPF